MTTAQTVQRRRRAFRYMPDYRTEGHQRDMLEQLCRYICRLAVSEKRLTLTSNGNIRYLVELSHHPNSKFRVRVTLAKRGRGRKPTGENWLDKTPAERHVAMTWMQRLKRVFNIDIETCERCKGRVKIIACI